MRQVYAFISSTIIHLLGAFFIYSLPYSVHDIPPALAVEARILDIGMLQGEELSQKQQSTRSEASQALASIESQASHGEREVVEAVAEHKAEVKSGPEPEPELEPQPQAHLQPQAHSQPQRKPTSTPKPKAELRRATAVKPITKSLSKSAVKQTPSQTKVGSGLAQTNRLKQEGTAIKSLGAQGQTMSSGQGAAYLAGLLHTISQRAARSYPQQARQMRHEGRARVAFMIQDDGHFTNIRLLHSSGHHSLDRAALNTVQRLGRYSEPPAGVSRQVSATIVFSLKR